MENTQMMTVVDDNEKLIADLSAPRQTMFCSLPVETEKQKAHMFNVSNNPEKRISDMINTTIVAKDLYCEVIQTVNKETGEINDAVRTIIIDEKGIGYVAVSRGIYNAVKKLIAGYGPPTWEKGIKIKPLQINKGERRMFTLAIDA